MAEAGADRGHLGTSSESNAAIAASEPPLCLMVKVMAGETSVGSGKEEERNESTLILLRLHGSRPCGLCSLLGQRGLPGASARPVPAARNLSAAPSSRGPGEATDLGSLSIPAARSCSCCPLLRLYPRWKRTS